MKNTIKILLLICVMLGVLMFACACGNTETPAGSTSSSQTTASSNDDSTGNDGNEPESTIKDYTVKALDPFGNPLEVSVIVEYFKDENTAAGIKKAIFA